MKNLPKIKKVSGDRWVDRQPGRWRLPVNQKSLSLRACEQLAGKVLVHRPSARWPRPHLMSTDMLHLPWLSILARSMQTAEASDMVLLLLGGVWILHLKFHPVTLNIWLLVRSSPTVSLVYHRCHYRGLPHHPHASPHLSQTSFVRDAPSYSGTPLQ